MMASGTSSFLKEKFETAFKDNNVLVSTSRDIASEIQSGDLKLHVFVEELGPFVTDKDASLREKGISLLSMVLSHLPKDYLNEAEVHFIALFYCDRLKDHHSIIPVVLKGVLAIVQMKHLPHDSPSSLVRVLFEHVTCQSQLLADRHNIYLILTTLLENRLDDLKTMGPDFIYGVISSIDGERDPRNLVLLFSILPYFLKQFPLGHLAEEMFDIIACYFPVDFNPSGVEELSITREDLAEKLEPCLCAVPEFAEFCLSLIADKLFSSLKVAKVDCLKLLCRGAPIFGSKGLEPHTVELWSALRKELLPGSDIELKNAALKALASIITALSDNTVLCESFIDKILTDTKSSLCDVQLSLFRPAEKLLEAVAMINKNSCTQVLRAVIPLCLGQYSTKTSLTDKVILVETMNNFLKITTNHGFNIKSVPELSWTDMPQLYLNELSIQHGELKSQILSGLAIQKAYLNEVHRNILYDALCNEIDIGCDQTKTVCHMCILSFATLYPQEILKLIKEKLVNNDKIEVKIQTRRLEALSAVAKTRELGIEVLPKIVSQAISDDGEISFTVLSCLRKLVITKNSDFDIHHYLFANCNIMEKLTSCKFDILDYRVNLISDILRLIVRNLTAEEQQETVNRYFTLLSETNFETTIVLIMNMFIPLRENVNISINFDLLENLYNFAKSSPNLYARETACKFTCVTLNKTNDEVYFRKILSYFKDKVATDVKKNSDIESNKAAVTLQVWLTKATVTRGSPDAENSLDDLSNFFNYEHIGQHVAHEYKILTDKRDDALTTENFCNIRFLYKQRVFEHLIQKNTKFSGMSRENYLTALVQLLDEVPDQLLFMKLHTLVPLLIESLSLDNEELIFSTLTTLRPLLTTKNSIFSDKAQTFIPTCLKLSSYKTMRVRIAALECLTSYCYYPTILTNIYKQDVLEKLLPVLDDRKRLVRKAATRARTKWFLVGAPVSTKEE